MAQLVIETSRRFPNYTLRMPLDGIEYLLLFRFNQRELSWYLDILDINERPLLQGVYLDANRSVLGTKWVRKCYVDNELVATPLPPGDIIPIDLTGDNRAPGLTELGEDARVVATYFDEAEILEIVASAGAV